jgi:hypothetical protein
MDQPTRRDIDWISDLFVKALCGAATILLGIAVHSLQSMSAEIKVLSTNVYELSSQSRLLAATLTHLEKRIDKMEKVEESGQSRRP